MTNLINTCRFCKKANYEKPYEGMFRYSLRHWAHWSCAVNRWGFEGMVAKLSRHQIGLVPLNIAEASPERLALLRSKL